MIKIYSFITWFYSIIILFSFVFLKQIFIAGLRVISMSLDNDTNSSDSKKPKMTESNHKHHHDRGSGSHKLLIMLTMTFLFFIVELVFGYFSHSMALIADSFHMLSDVMALGIAFGCMRVSNILSINI